MPRFTVGDVVRLTDRSFGLMIASDGTPGARATASYPDDRVRCTEKAVRNGWPMSTCEYTVLMTGVTCDAVSARNAGEAGIRVRTEVNNRDGFRPLPRNSVLLQSNFNPNVLVWVSPERVESKGSWDSDLNPDRNFRANSYFTPATATLTDVPSVSNDDLNDEYDDPRDDEDFVW